MTRLEEIVNEVTERRWKELTVEDLADAVARAVAEDAAEHLCEREWPMCAEWLRTRYGLEAIDAD